MATVTINKLMGQFGSASKLSDLLEEAAILLLRSQDQSTKTEPPLRES